MKCVVRQRTSGERNSHTTKISATTATAIIVMLFHGPAKSLATTSSHTAAPTVITNARNGKISILKCGWLCTTTRSFWLSKSSG